MVALGYSQTAHMVTEKRKFQAPYRLNFTEPGGLRNILDIIGLELKNGCDLIETDMEGSK